MPRPFRSVVSRLLDVAVAPETLVTALADSDSPALASTVVSTDTGRVRRSLPVGDAVLFVTGAGEDRRHPTSPAFLASNRDAKNDSP